MGKIRNFLKSYGFNQNNCFSLDKNTIIYAQLKTKDLKYCTYNIAIDLRNMPQMGRNVEVA